MQTHLQRALLEVIAAGVVSSKADINRFVRCTLLSAQKLTEQQQNINNVSSKNIENDGIEEYIDDVLNFLLEYEFIRKQKIEDITSDGDQQYLATRLGKACLCKIFCHQYCVHIFI